MYSVAFTSPLTHFTNKWTTPADMQAECRHWELHILLELILLRNVLSDQMATQETTHTFIVRSVSSSSFQLVFAYRSSKKFSTVKFLRTLYS